MENFVLICMIRLILTRVHARIAKVCISKILRVERCSRYCTFWRLHFAIFCIFLLHRSRSGAPELTYALPLDRSQLTAVSLEEPLLFRALRQRSTGQSCTWRTPFHLAPSRLLALLCASSILASSDSESSLDFGFHLERLCVSRVVIDSIWIVVLL